MQVQLINLDRSPERLAEFQARNAHLSDVRRFAAIDGRTVDRAALVERSLFDGRTRYGNGAVGVALSHLQLWQAAIDGGQPLTICEDDAIFHRDFESRAAAAIGGLAPGWDLILWGWNFDSFLQFDLVPGCSWCLAQFDQAQMRKGIDAFQGHAVAPTLYKLLRAFGIVCYTISPLGAARLRQAVLPIRPLEVYFPGLNRKIPNLGIDIVMNALYPRLNAFVCLPPLVITENRHEISTVQGDRSVGPTPSNEG